MKIIALALLMQGCLSSPVTVDEWDSCFYQCRPGPVREACDNVLHGFTCKCETGEDIWMDEITDYN